MASYVALADLYLPGDLFVQAGATLSDSNAPGSLPIPVGWLPPSGAVDPIDTQAVQNYFNAGPGAASSAQPYQVLLPGYCGGMRWTGQAIPSPIHVWYRVPHGFALKGGESLGVWPA
jgi:hypothetical protein